MMHVRSCGRGARMRHRLAPALVVLLGGLRSGPRLSPIATAATTPPSGSRPRHRAFPRAQPGSARCRRTSRSAISVVLRPSHTDRLTALLNDLYDPSSPRYGSVARRPASSTASSARAPTRSAASRRGCTHKGLNDTSVQGMAVHVTGRRSRRRARVRRLVRRATASRRARPATPRRRRRWCRVPSPPASPPSSGSPTPSASTARSIRSTTQADRIRRRRRGADARIGLARRTRRLHTCAQATNFAGNAYWTPRQVGSLYHVNDLFAAGLTGKGKTIALLELGQSRPADTSRTSCVLRPAQHRAGRARRRRRARRT